MAIGVRGVGMPACVLALVLASTLGCSALLPHEESAVVSHWDSFDAAKQAYEQITPYQTGEEELMQLGFSPQVQPNVRILNHAEIAQHFLVGAVDDAMLPPALHDCFMRYATCYGYELRRRAMEDRRYGNFLADFMNFRRKTETRGWEFSALIVLIDGQVVYKLWSGTPEIRQKRDETNPLGPLQDIGPSLTPSPEL